MCCVCAAHTKKLYFMASVFCLNATNNKKKCVYDSWMLDVQYKNMKYQLTSANKNKFALRDVIKLVG